MEWWRSLVPPPFYWVPALKSRHFLSGPAASWQERATESSPVQQTPCSPNPLPHYTSLLDLLFTKLWMNWGELMWWHPIILPVLIWTVSLSWRYFRMNLVLESSNFKRQCIFSSYHINACWFCFSKAGIASLDKNGKNVAQWYRPSMCVLLSESRAQSCDIEVCLWFGHL